MPRTLRNPGAGKSPVNTPASGIPRGGAGWGGPAKGYVEKPPRARTAEDSERSREIAADPVAMAAINRRKMAKEERAADHLEFLEAVALGLPFNGQELGAELPTRVSASVHALDRLEGKPMQKSLILDPLAGVDQEKRRAIRQAILQELGDLARPAPLTIEQDGGGDG